MKKTAQFLTAVFWIFTLLGSMSAADEQKIDPSWKKYLVTISYIDTKERVFVASDREFFVPFNIAIFNQNQQ